MTSLKDFPRIIVINIDNQNDFVKKNGSLSVPGAMAAAERAAKFIDINSEKITTIISSFDRHLGLHIFYGNWWKNVKKEYPADLTKITYIDVLKGNWVPRFDEEWSTNYVRTLGSLTIWPKHCTQHSYGSEMVSILEMAISTHSIVRRSRPVKIEKGQNARTEHYGIFGAEVEDPDDPRTKLNTRLMQEISAYDQSFWFGEEKGHCVQLSLELYIGWCEKNRPYAIGRMRYVGDCIGSLQLGPEYQKATEDSVKSMVAKGMKVVKSTDSIG
jgi:nicotinamidase-related amidase